MKKCPCGKKSVPGLVRSVALCQKHFNGLMYKSGPEHSEAISMLRKSQDLAMKR